MGYEDFNVVTSPWVPVVNLDGTRSVMSVLELIERAHIVRDVDAGAPDKRFSIFRFIQELIYWSAGRAPTKEEIDSWVYEDPIDHSWCSKVRANVKLFDLFGDGDRFCQVSADRAEGKLKDSPAKLLLRLPQATAISFNTHVQDATCGVCPECLAMGLIQVPTFSFPGGSGYVPGICGKVPVFFVRTGRNFAATIRLNLPTSDLEIGVPSWVEQKPIPPEGALTILQSMTHFPRKCRLGPVVVRQPCSSCGEVRSLVQKIYFASDAEKPVDDASAEEKKAKKVKKTKAKKEKEEKVKNPNLPFDPNGVVVIGKDGPKYVTMPNTSKKMDSNVPKGMMGWARYLATACRMVEDSACESVWVLGTSNDRSSMIEFYEARYPAESLSNGDVVDEITSKVLKACREARSAAGESIGNIIASKMRNLDASLEARWEAFCRGDTSEISKVYARWLTDATSTSLGSDDLRRVLRSASIIGDAGIKPRPRAERTTSVDGYAACLGDMSEEDLTTVRLTLGRLDATVQRTFNAVYWRARKVDNLRRDAAWTVMYLYACHPGSRMSSDRSFPEALASCRPRGGEAFDLNVRAILDAGSLITHRRRLSWAIGVMERAGVAFSWDGLVDDVGKWSRRTSKAWGAYFERSW